MSLLQETSVKFLRYILRILQISTQVFVDPSLFTPTGSERYIVSIPISSRGMTLLRKLFSSTRQQDPDGTSLVPPIKSLGVKFSQLHMEARGTSLVPPITSKGLTLRSSYLLR